jgi:molybdopterin-guanine dinucleotide biosynthesis protein A
VGQKQRSPLHEVGFSPVILLCVDKLGQNTAPAGLATYEGRPWIEHQLTCLALAGLREAVIVLGPAAEDYLRKLPWLVDALLRRGTEAFGLRVRALISPQPQFGAFAALQAGAANAQRLPHAFSGFFWILPVEVPCPSPEVWEKLARSRAQACVPERLGRGAHPLRLSDAFLRRIRRLPPTSRDSRLDRQIQLLGSEAERIEIEEPVKRRGARRAPGRQRIQ